MGRGAVARTAASQHASAKSTALAVNATARFLRGRPRDRPYLPQWSRFHGSRTRTGQLAAGAIISLARKRAQLRATASKPVRLPTAAGSPCWCSHLSGSKMLSTSRGSVMMWCLPVATSRLKRCCCRNLPRWNGVCTKSGNVCVAPVRLEHAPAPAGSALTGRTSGAGRQLSAKSHHMRAPCRRCPCLRRRCSPACITKG